MDIKDNDYSINMINKRRSERKTAQAILLENSSKEHGARELVAEKGKMDVEKSKFKKLCSKPLLIIICILILLSSIFSINSSISRLKKEDYVASEIIPQCIEEIVDYDVSLIPKMIPEQYQDMYSVVQILKDKYCNGDEKLALYVIDRLYSDKGFELTVQALGYQDANDFLIQNGFYTANLSWSGETVYGKYGDKGKFKSEYKRIYDEWLKEVVETNRKAKK